MTQPYKYIHSQVSYLNRTFSQREVSLTLQCVVFPSGVLLCQKEALFSMRQELGISTWHQLRGGHLLPGSGATLPGCNLNLIIY